MTSVLKERMLVTSARVGDAVPPALLALLLAQSALVIVAHTVFSLLGLPGALGSLLVYALLAIAVAAALPAILRRADRRVGLVGALLLCAFAVGALLGQGSEQFYSQIAARLLIGLGWMTVAYAVRDYRQCRRYLYPAGLVTLVAVGIQLSAASSGATMAATYSQEIGYSALPAVLIFVDAAFERMRFLNGALAVVSGWMMLSSGARGPIVVAALYILARVVLQVRASPRLAVVVAGVGVLATWLAAQFVGDYLAALQLLLERFGLSTRVVARLQEGSLLEDRARTELIQHTFNLIAQHPFAGVGMSNERPILAKLMGAAPDTEAIGWYPHNVFLELLAQFGVILGALLILLLLTAILRAVVTSKDLDRRALVLVFVGLGLLPLLFSASYLSWPTFFGLLGLCLSNNAPPPPAPLGRSHRDASRD